MVLYFMRHGETELNREGRLQGSLDEPLNEKGREQAMAAGEQLRQKGLRFDHVITSPLDRARETAELATGLDRAFFETEERIREMDFGPYEGKRIRKLSLPVLLFLRYPYKRKTPQGMESVESVFERVSSFLESLRQRDDLESVMIVSHGIAMHVMLGYMRGLSSMEVWKDRLSVENGTVYRTETTELGFSEPEKI